MKGIEDLIKFLKNQNREEETIALIRDAHDFAARAHEEQYRLSGESFIVHPVNVAGIIAELELDRTSIMASLLHDVLEDTAASREEVAESFGEEVTQIVEGVTKLSRIDFKSREEHQAENLRKMFLAMAEDIRVVIVKLADRLHNMRTLEHVGENKRENKARETLDIYAPLAHRLGMFRMKWELEDLSFRYLEPEMYKELEARIDEGMRTREKDIQIAMEILQDKLSEMGVHVEISGRAKHLYSIYQKMTNDDRGLEEIYDLIAMRILTENIRNCYEVLGVVHELWKPIPGRFKDYIAVPKSNMYQSLHTTVIGPRGSPLEVQIRTWEMHRTAEYGIAAHWRYKERKKGNAGEFDRKLAWLRQLLEWQKDMQDAQEFMDSLRVDLFEDEVFVFTPRGDVVSLPRGATPVDFAFSIHTEVGNQCVGAKVNGKLVSLEYEVGNGDIVEIITSKTSSGPSQDWLKFAKTSRARNKIRRHVKQQRKQEIVVEGKEALEKELKRQGLKLREAEKEKRLEEAAQNHNLKDGEELLAAIGFGTIPVGQIVNKFFLKEEAGETDILEKFKEEAQPRVSRDRDSGVQVMGVDDIYVRLSRCCNPVPGDQIIGYITRGRGVSIHRRDCSNIKHLLADEGRTVAARWTSRQEEAYSVDLKIRAINKSGLLNEITSIISNSKLNISAINAQTSRNHTAVIDISLEVSSLQQLKDIRKKLITVDGVLSVSRESAN